MSTVLPEHLLKLMSPEDRAKLGEAGVTASEAQRKWQGREEAKMHDTVTQWLRLRRIPTIHARMDKASTIRKGWPDITAMWNGRVACSELKAPGGTVSQEQAEVLSELIAAGIAAEVHYSAEAAITFFRFHLLKDSTNPLA